MIYYLESGSSTVAGAPISNLKVMGLNPAQVDENMEKLILVARCNNSLKKQVRGRSLHSVLYCVSLIKLLMTLLQLLLRIVKCAREL